MHKKTSNIKLDIICGAGGVGKTTITAAIGVKNALAGKKTLIITIDPARRLANVLGLDTLPSEPFPIDLGQDETNLYAMMVDRKEVADEIVRVTAKNKNEEEFILNNRFYKTISSTLSGSHEYIALGKLHEIIFDAGEFEVVVLDTAPSKHALEFLKTPENIGNFLKSDLTKWLVSSPDFVKKSLMHTVMKGSYIVKQFDKNIGFQFFIELADFMLAFEPMFTVLQKKAGEIGSFLQNSENVDLTIVCTPTKASVNDTNYIYKNLKEMGMIPKQIIFNKVNRGFYTDQEEKGSRAWLKNEQSIKDQFLQSVAQDFTGDPQGLGDICMDVLSHVKNLYFRQEFEAQCITHLKSLIEVQSYNFVPLLDTDIQSTEGLNRIVPFLEKVGYC